MYQLSSFWRVVTFPDMGRVDGGGKNDYSYFGHIFEVLIRHPSEDFIIAAKYMLTHKTMSGL